MVISLKVFFTPFAFLFWVQVGELRSNLFDVGLTTDLNEWKWYVACVSSWQVSFDKSYFCVLLEFSLCGNLLRKLI